MDILNPNHRHPAGSLRRRGRAGVAAVELALCVPFLLTLAFGMIEICNLVYLDSRITTVAYEGARLATRPTTSTAVAASAATVTARCNALLTQLKVQGGLVTLNPADLSTLAPQSLVTVTITAPLSRNSVTSLVINSSQNVTGKATLIFE